MRILRGIVTLMSFICTRMKNDFHIKGWAPTLVLKQRPGGTRKWPIHWIKLHPLNSPTQIWRKPTQSNLKVAKKDCGTWFILIYFYCLSANQRAPFSKICALYFLIFALCLLQTALLSANQIIRKLSEALQSLSLPGSPLFSPCLFSQMDYFVKHNWGL